MRQAFAVFLVLALLVPAVPTAVADHREEARAPSPVVSEVFKDVLLQVADEINATREKVGEDDPLIQQAADRWKKASRAHNGGDDWLTLAHLVEAVTFMHRAEIEHDTRGASDQDAAFFSRTEAAWNEGQGWISSVHERMLDLQSLGVDLWMLDHTLLAGDILAQGERIYKSWTAVAQGWEDGQRGDQAKNGLVGFSYGAILHADIADQLIDKALDEAPEEPVGPTVGNSTLQGTMEALNPLVANASVSFDRQLNSIVSGNMGSGEWLAALGAATTWARAQPSAAVQHTLGESEDKQYDPVAVVERLRTVLTDDPTFEVLDDLGTEAAQAQYSLAQADATLHLTQRSVEEGNETTRTSLEAAEGLGAASAAHMNLAILQLVAGEDPPREIVHLPASNGTLNIDRPADPSGDDGEAGTNLLGSPWFWVVGVLAAGAIAAVGYRRKP